MCGIFFYNGILKDIVNLLEAAWTISPRGPEHTTIDIKNTSSNSTIHCFHRLAINNTSESCNQPYIYKDGKYTYTVMCNGEIYNWKQLINSFTLIVEKHNDCGVIFPLFKDINFDFKKLCSLLDGEFAIVITRHLTDSSKIDKIWFGTDVCSVRPLFYTYDSNSIVLSSLLSGISKIKNLTSKIYRVDGAKAYEFYLTDKGDEYQLVIENYDDIFDKNNTVDVLDVSVYMDNIYNKFTEAVHKRICKDNMSRPIGCLLSGGLDSSLVAAVASKYLKQYGEKLNTFSIGMKGSTDLKYAKIVAEYIGSNHTEILFTEKEGVDVIKDVVKATETYDITTIRASVGQYLVAKWISENTDIKILLNGDGADEIEMGYLYFYNAPNEEEAQKDSVRLVRNIHYFDGLRVDRNISYHGLEARVPFLDKELVRYYLNEVHSGYKMAGFLACEKTLIRSAFEKYDMLPKEVLWRRKEAFSDGVSSEEKSWYQILTDYFNSMSIPSEMPRAHNSPYTKESSYYRTLFDLNFGERNDNVIPYYWLPSWTNEKDPSARKLNVYSKKY